MEFLNGNELKRGGTMRLPVFAQRFAVVIGIATLALCTLPAYAAEGTFDRTLQVNGAVNLHIGTGSVAIDVHNASSILQGPTCHVNITATTGATRGCADNAGGR